MRCELGPASQTTATASSHANSSGEPRPPKSWNTGTYCTCDRAASQPAPGIAASDDASYPSSSERHILIVVATESARKGTQAKNTTNSVSAMDALRISGAGSRRGKAHL